MDAKLVGRQRTKNKPGRNGRCWCGSGKKYKFCHLGREAQTKLGQQEAIKRYAKRSKKGQCLHPDAGPTTCSSQVIAAHSIQRNGGLNHIARDGHVSNLLMHKSKLDLKPHELNKGPYRVGVREASTFKGFCSHHDNELFTLIDDKPFEGNIEQIMLLGYRSICHELHSKRFALDLDGEMKEFDKGEPAWFQQAYQDALSTRDLGIQVSIKELNDAKELYEGAILKNIPADISYYCVFFDRLPDLLCSGVCQATHDFRGEELMDLGDLSMPASWLSFAVIVGGDKGAAVFSCPASHKESIKVLSTLDELSNDELPHAIIRFAFEFFENTYFSLDWWNGLGNETKASLKKRQLTEAVSWLGDTKYSRSADCLLDDGVHAVDWQVLSKIVSISSRNGISTPTS